MKDTAALLKVSDFPPISRATLDTLQINLGYLCNLSCTHCHVNAGPTRTELMDAQTIDDVLKVAEQYRIANIDLTGGSPEMNPEFKRLVSNARASGIHVMDRCNPTILVEPGYEDMAHFLAEHQVTIIASMPCYEPDNVDRQRGKGTYNASIEGLRRLNQAGYGQPGSGLVLNLVYNPDEPILPPDQKSLEAEYRASLGSGPGISFNELFVLANMPIARFGARLLARDQFYPYMQLLRASFSEENLEKVMCRNLISIDYQGYIYDCDFNQMLGLPTGNRTGFHLRDLLKEGLPGGAICVGEHCYGCTAGQGSSCGGALS
jgi:radical SAM/Cys-rich protein